MSDTDNGLNAGGNNSRSKLAEIERERLTRRQALRKIGLTSTMSVLALLTVDDLARMAAGVLQRNAGDNQLANQVANEFKNSGVAMASGLTPAGSIPPGMVCSNWITVANYCSAQNPFPIAKSGTLGSGFFLNSGQKAANTACSTCVGQVYGPNGACAGKQTSGIAGPGNNSTNAKGACQGRSNANP